MQVLAKCSLSLDPALHQRNILAAHTQITMSYKGVSVDISWKRPYIIVEFCYYWWGRKHLLNEKSLLFLRLPQIPVEGGNLWTVPTKLLHWEEGGLLNWDFSPQKGMGADRLQAIVVSSASDRSAPTDVPADTPPSSLLPPTFWALWTSSVPPCTFGRGKKALRTKTAHVRWCS